MGLTTKLPVIIALATTCFGQGLCPGSGSAPEKDGILAALQQIGKLIPPANAGAKLSLIDLEAQGVCQYWFLSQEKRQKLIFIDVQGTIRLSGTVPIAGTELGPLPAGFVDLPEAISAAQRQGIQLPLDSAKLMMAQPRGKPAVAVWTLTPRARTGRVLSYFVSAADPGHTLQLSDVTDYFSDYNAQRRYMVDMFHPAQQASSPVPPVQNTQTPPIEGTPCILPGITWTKGRWLRHFGNQYFLDCKL